MNRALFVATLACAGSIASAQVISWTAPVSGSWSDPTRWNPADVPDRPVESALLGLQGAYTVILDLSPTIGGLSILNPAASLEVPADRSLTLAGDVHNDGRIRLLADAGSAWDAALRFTGDAQLSGSGEIRLLEDSDSVVQTLGMAMLSHGAGHTIAGRGEVAGRLDNLGVIDADSAGGVLRLTGDVSNHHVLRATGGGVLELNGVVIAQSSPGVIRAEEGVVRFVGLNRVGGGTLESAGSGLVRIETATTTLEDVTVRADVLVPHATTLGVDGSILRNHGLIRLLAASGHPSDATLHFLTAGTLAGTGEVRLEELADAVISSEAGVPVTQGSEHTISGIGVIAAPLVNEGTLRPGLPIGPLTLESGLIDKGQSSLEIEIAGTAAHDVVVVAGQARLDGVLRVETVGGFEIPPCSRFVVLTATGGVLDRFAVEDLPPVPMGRVQVAYEPNAVLVRYLPADVNNTGTVDFFDYLDFVAAFDQEDPLADFNHDRTVDFFDYLDFVAMFDVGC